MSDIDKDQLKRLVLDHYKNPRNRVNEPMEDASVVERGHNPQCGDEIEVGLYIEDQTIRDIKFRGRGCSICIATASIMIEHIKGQSIPASTQLATTTLHWLKHEIHTSGISNSSTKHHTTTSSTTKVTTNTNNNTSTDPNSTPLTHHHPSRQWPSPSASPSAGAAPASPGKPSTPP